MVSKIASCACRQLERAHFAGCVPPVSSASGSRGGTLSSSRLAQIMRDKQLLTSAEELMHNLELMHN